MISSRHKIAFRILLVLCAATVLAACVATAVLRFREKDSVPDVQKIARTLNIIRSSSPNNRKVLKVLFYGQSITKSGWHEAVVEHWHALYPNTVFVVQNRALGGFPSQALVRTTEQDIAAFYPDLIIFHVYGDHRAYEKIIRLFRSRTAADIIVQTDHGEVLPDPRCAEGLHLALSRPPGCAGFLWYRQRMWNDEMSYHKIPALARKYALAVEPQRDWWRQYLIRTGTNPRDLLSDDPHPNARGKELIAAFFNRYFDGLVSQYQGETARDVTVLQPTESERAAGNEVVGFDGTRLELVTGKPLAVWPAVTVDGQPPSNLDGCYQVSRASSIGTVLDWPALRRISLLHDHAAEVWTATLTDFSPDQKDFNFTVQGATSGPEGKGRSGQRFVSSSGSLQIEPGDWMVERAWDHTHVALHGPFQVTWSVDYVCGANPEVIDRGNGVMEYRYVLAAGLTDTLHSVTIKGPVEDFRNIDHLTAYTPRIRNLESVVGW
jgi:hypothetical protein